MPQEYRYQTTAVDTKLHRVTAGVRVVIGLDKRQACFQVYCTDGVWREYAFFGVGGMLHLVHHVDHCPLPTDSEGRIIMGD